MEVTLPGEQRYEMKITATGEVRDADGNLVSQEPIEVTRVVTQSEMERILKR